MKFNKNDVICRDDCAYPEGALVCAGYDEAGRLLAHALGGGLQLVVPTRDEPRFRVVAEGERSAALFRRARLTLGDSVRAFNGWTNGQAWNGWAMPRFEVGVVMEILEFLGDGGRFDGEADAFVTVSQDGEEETWAAEVITVGDGSRIKVYGLGAGSWMWEAL